MRQAAGGANKPMTESSHPSGPISGRFPVRPAFELAIVFLGVYGAFWAESVRERREQEQKARSIYAALAEEIRDPVVQGQLVLDEYVEAQTEWERRVDRGEKPTPWFIPWTRIGPPRATWQATVASGGIGLIDQDLFYVLVKYYRGVEMLLVAVDARDPFAENEILPFSGDGPDRFYEGSELRPRFRYYMDRRRTILAGAQRTIDDARVILAELDARTMGGGGSERWIAAKDSLSI